MTAKFCFQIRELNPGAGFELNCQGVLDIPLLRPDINQALHSACKIGQALDAEVQIFNHDGMLQRVLPLHAALNEGSHQ